MLKQLEVDSITLSYPETWQLEQEETDEGWTVSLQSPGTAFVLLTCDSSMPTTEEMAEATLEALRSDYPTLEADVRIDTLAGQMALGHDIQFFSFDLTNTCWTRSIYSPTGTLLLLCQVNDLELDEYEQALRAICASVQVDEE